MKSLEVQGLPTKQAEAVTSAITEVLNDTLERVAQSYTPKEEVQKVMKLYYNIIYAHLEVDL